MTIELSNMSTSELDSLIETAKQRKEAVRESEIAALKALAEDMKERASRLGVSLFGLIKPTPKNLYRDPNDTSKTWSGRGKRPKWLTDLIEASGETLAHFRVGSE